jgi:predicted Rossmann fold flavoprotein
MNEADGQFELVILGGGAAGMMAAVAAAEELATPVDAAGGARIAVFEKNVRVGIKVLVCGGGRCNFTNAGSTEELIAAFGRNGRFLSPALRHLDNAGLRAFFERLGVPSHVEHDGKVYPDSNQARSVVDALVRRMGELGVRTFAGATHAVTGLQRADATKERAAKHDAPFVVETVGGIFRARMVILALGGMSYQRMGTVGDGYRLAAALGHTIRQPRPAIVGLLAQEAWVKDLQGLAVRRVEVTIVPAKGSRRKAERSRGDMLFTHFGLSGPAILNPSEIVAEMLETAATVELQIDFVPGVPHEQVHATFRQWQQQHGKKRLRTMLADPSPEVTIQTTSPDQTAIEVSGGRRENPVAMPARLAVKVCELEGVSPEQPCATLTAAQMHRLGERLKRCPFTITATRGFQEAMVTAGGIDLREVDPRTLESRIVPNLFLTGEVLDLTGPSGGYNLQLAFSTGHLAGTTAGRR